MLALLPSPWLWGIQRGEAGCGQLGLQLICCLGEGKNKVLLPPLCREPGANASAVCCIQQKALILLCCQYTFVGEGLIPCAVSAASERMHAWSCPSLFPSGCNRLG